MRKDSFALRQNDDYIELLKLLQIKGFAQTGGHAKIIIDEGSVSVNGETEYRKRKKLRPGDQVSYEDHLIEILAAAVQ